MALPDRKSFHGRKVPGEKFGADHRIPPHVAKCVWSDARECGRVEVELRIFASGWIQRRARPVRMLTRPPDIGVVHTILHGIGKPIAERKNTADLPVAEGHLGSAMIQPALTLADRRLPEHGSYQPVLLAVIG